MHMKSPLFERAMGMPPPQDKLKRKESRKKFQISIHAESQITQEMRDIADTTQAIAYLDFLLNFLSHANPPEEYNEEEYNETVLRMWKLNEMLKKKLRTLHT